DFAVQPDTNSIQQNSLSLESHRLAAHVAILEPRLSLVNATNPVWAAPYVYSLWQRSNAPDGELELMHYL
ncbi:hypothetical protein COCVIDRAFT_114019, partial [Bipolaris victoriae FI3]